MRIRGLGTLALTATVLSASPVSATGYTESKLTASDGAASDRYGVAVAVDGDTIVVGSYLDDGVGTDSGAAYVYKPDGLGGYTETTLTASDAAAGDNFGLSVAASGGTIIVGSYLDDDGAANSGSVYVYRPNGGGGYTETKLTASDAAADDNLGWSVALSGDTIVAGARLDDDGGTDSGSAYVYEPNGVGGYTETKLTASDAAANDLFGASVAVSGDTVVIGAYGDDDGVSGTDSGSIYVYKPNGAGGYTETKLNASDAAANDLFGASVAVDGDTIVAGSWFDDDGGFNAGAAYVYKPNGAGGYSETKLTASDAAANDSFGRPVAVDGDTVVVGAFLDDDGSTNSGSAYVYALSEAGGYSETKLNASDAAGGDFFGISVAVSGTTVVVGASFNDHDGLADAGAVYVFEPAPSCEGHPVTVDIGAGDSPTAGDDVILGTPGDDMINTLAGNDLVCAGGGNDTVIGADGNDIIYGQAGDDTLAGNAGDDQIYGGPDKDRAFGGSGNDVVHGGIGSDFALGGGSGMDSVFGEDGNDTLTGGSDDDIVVSGGNGNDAVNGGTGDDPNVLGDNGDDTVSGNGGNDVVNGGPGNDEVRGGKGNDQVNGDEGDDFVAGNAGTDTCDGGPDTDTAATNCETVLNVP